MSVTKVNIPFDYEKPHLVSFVENGNRFYVRPDAIRLACNAVKDDGTPCLRIEFDTNDYRVLAEITDPFERSQAERKLEQLECMAVVFNSDGGDAVKTQ